jgi:hypothetical protein
VPLYRLTENDNPSVRIEDEFAEVFVVDGGWVFAEMHGADRIGTAPGSGPWPTSDYTVETEEHGGTWRTLDPDDFRRRPDGADAP